MIFCPKCGTQNDDGAAFCGNCGAQFPKAAADTEPMPAADTAPMPNDVPAAVPQPGAAVSPAPAAAAIPASAGKSRMPLIIAAAVVLIALVVLLFVFVIPRCTGAGPAGSANLTTLNTASTSDARATLSKMKSADLEGYRYYASSDDMINYVDDLIASARNGKLDGWSDVMNAEKAKKLNGQWVLVSTADSSYQDAVDMVKSQYDIDLGHMTAYATVVSDNDLTNEEVANLVSGAGLSFEHAQVYDATVDEAVGFLRQYLKLYAKTQMSSYGYYGYSSDYSAEIDEYINQYVKEINRYGVERVSMGTFYGAETIGMSVAVQFDGYAMVLVWSDNPANYGMDDLINADTVKRMYVK